MRPPILDPTAGERARGLRLNPDAPTPIPDPTDPRFGEPVGTRSARRPDAERIVDPTDPACGSHRA